MKRKFSTAWKASKKPRKQRKYVHKALPHIKNKLVSSHLSKELKKKYNKRSVRVKKNDKVKVLSGQFRGKSGKIDRIDANRSKVYITGIDTVKKDGSKASYPIHSSNLVITDIDLSDKRRLKRIKLK